MTILIAICIGISIVRFDMLGTCDIYKGVLYAVDAYKLRCSC